MKRLCAINQLQDGPRVYFSCDFESDVNATNDFETARNALKQNPLSLVSWTDNFSSTHGTLEADHRDDLERFRGYLKENKNWEESKD